MTTGNKCLYYGMAVLILSVLSLGATPHVYELPPRFSDWGDTSFYHFGENDPWRFWKTHFPDSVPSLSDTSLLPCFNTSKRFHFKNPVGDSAFGYLQYVPSDTSGLKGRVHVYWYPHQDGELNAARITHCLYPNPWIISYGFLYDRYSLIEFAVEEEFDTIMIGEYEAYRHRGRWRDSQCTGTYKTAGSFTAYYIPGGRFDFHVYCRTQTYLYDEEEGYEHRPAEIHHWPDRIRKLERAIQRTFQVKE